MRTIRFHGASVNFPDACQVCLGVPHQDFPVERTFFYGRNSLPLKISVPLCYDHYKIASRKSSAQMWSERLSPVAGALLGLVVCLGLLAYWSAEGTSTPMVFTIPVAVAAGLSMGVTCWAILLFWISPALSSSAAKKVQGSVRMTRYDPYRQVLDLTFENDSAAELTARANLPLLILEEKPWRQYEISAHMVDHDIRYSSTITTQVLLDHPPSDEEARMLLRPVIDRVLAAQMGLETFYELDSISVREVERE